MRYIIFPAAAGIPSLRNVAITLALCLANLGLSLGGRAASNEETASALATDGQGWSDILPSTDLKNWSRVPVPPTGKLGRAQWHIDSEKKVLICDGDGGHDMLLWDKELADAVFHLEFRYTKVEGKTG